ncbi:hypothetical protein BTA31_17475 [Bacillus haynesii]|uniref:Uncharacterized protein n=1 Tax=Bacillus haynesii TaxID=1925021 RepID=A0ABX3I0X6_9BACI|nr:hypothetical protein BTA31_17475 [Bacillus haynesii]
MKNTEVKVNFVIETDDDDDDIIETKDIVQFFLLQFLLIKMKQARTMLACFKDVRVSLKHRIIQA